MRRLDQLWGSPTAKVSTWQLQKEEAKIVAVEAVLQETKEVAAREMVGQPFVKRGSRDALGNQRSRVGGRPKKVAVLEERPSPDKGKKSIGGSSRKKRNEQPATEKVKILDRYHSLEEECLQQISGETRVA